MSKLELLGELIIETIEFQSKRDISLFKNGFSGFRNIDGYGSALISSHMSKLVGRISDIMYEEDKTLWRSWNKAEWAKLVERTFLDEYFSKFVSRDPAEIISDLLSSLETQLNLYAQTGSVKFASGCDIFSISIDEKIEFGKVCIVSRSSWINECRKSGILSDILLDHLRFSWGILVGPVREISDQNEIRLKDEIHDFVGRGSYICEVDVSGLVGEAAKAKAVMAMNFAMIAICLTWNKPSRALRNMSSTVSGYPQLVHHAILVDGSFIANSSRWTGGFGQNLIQTNWNEISKEYCLVFNAVSEVIDYCLSKTGDVSRPKLMDSLAHSLIWFHEACEEELPMVAITKFVASLDALASDSSGAGGIIRVVTSRLGVGENDPIRAGGPSFKEAITEIYSQGRSRLLHGSSDRLMQDWQSMRNLAEELARHCIVQCLAFVGENPSINNPKEMQNCVQ